MTDQQVVDQINSVIDERGPKERRVFIEKLRAAIEADGKIPPAEKTLYAKLKGSRGIEPWILPYIAKVLGVQEQDLFDPSKREIIAREELRKHPAKYYDEMDLKGTVKAEVMSATAAAGTGNNIESIDEFSTGEYAVLDDRLFKVKPRNLKLMRVDGHSMAPMLYPDSWVAYEPADEYTVDGLYVINYGNELMVKLLQYDPAENMLEIVSKNPDYKSYKIRPDDQSVFRIVGRVLRCII